MLELWRLTLLDWGRQDLDLQRLLSVLNWGFLAAMSSSRSDVVTKCVRVSVCVSLFSLLVSLEFYLVLKCFKGVSRVFQECFKNVLGGV